MKITTTLLFVLLATVVFSQKRIIDHTAYNDWKSLSNNQISYDGKFVTYEINPHRGDGYLYIYSIENDKLDSIPRGKNAAFSGNSNYVAFKITPGFDTLRTCELDKIDKKKWPKDSLGIYFLKSDSLIKFERVSSFSLNSESDWMAFMSEDNKLEDGKSGKKKKKKKKNAEPEYTSTGNLLTILNPTEGKEKKFKDVKSFSFSKKGTLVGFVTHKKEKTDSMRLHVYTTSGPDGSWTANRMYTDLTGVKFNEQETQLSYLSSMDTSKVKTYAVNLLDWKSQKLTLIADTNQTFLEYADAVSKNFEPSFTKDGKILYFGTAERPKEDPKDTLVDDEKVKLDLWHYQDKRLQPQQLIELKQDVKKTSLYAYHISSGDAVRLSDDTMNVQAITDVKSEYLFGMSNERYAGTYNWVTPYPEDHYRISLKTGKVELLREGTEFGGSLSPSGKYYTYFSSEKNNHYAIQVDTKKEICLTCTVDNVLWVEDINGMPMKPSPLGTIGWNKAEDKIYIQSEYDVWQYDFNANKASSLTHEEGKERSIELRAEMWNRDSVYVDYDNMYIKGFNKKTKGVHYFTLTDHGDHMDILEGASYDAKTNAPVRSKDKSQILLRKMTAIEYPDLHLANANFQTTKKISNTNPQQSEYNWTTVELIDWTSYDDKKLEGLLYKPENYDPTKEYPLMVYFYELYSHDMHQHYIPKPTASIIFATEYASAGYFVFIPDIRYEEGHPAQSAYDCILSGTDRVLELYPNVDSTRMALQGQSWGGYQTAQLVTMTNRYKAAMAGAPVTNMFSAYGGIRWGSGLNRQFQYERTQSRIGYTIWEKPELYVENSPQFHLPKVETPLLIMHNDKDGAVPWYQGIELFTGLKRLGKTVWMLNYNDEEHNLLRNANRIDLSIRMRQFFDHYLLDKEAPQWLLEGIPSTVKGKELRY